MTTRQPSDEELSLFSKLFSGYEGAYGEYEVNRTEDSGKKLGKAVTLMRPASLADYKKHLSGVTGIGIIPLLKSDKCWFGAIDIDIKGDTKLSETHENLESKIRKLKLPLMLFRSKSNGAHLYLFGKEPISARLLQSRLAEFAALLGYAGCEVFPKQVTRIRNDGTDFGNWINIPLFGDGRVGMFEGKELDTLTSLKTCQYLATTEDELRSLNLAGSAERFSDAPPCLQKIAAAGVSEGNRNNALFNYSVYFRNKYPDEWQEKLHEFNEESVDPPLSDAEMKELKKQSSRRDYFYTCNTAPICNFCDKKLCLTRRYGIGNKEDEDGSYTLPITGLTKYVAGDNKSYRWGVSTSEAMLEFSTDELLDLNVHRRKFAELMNFLIPQMKQKDFMKQMQVLLDKAETVYDPEDASEEGELIANIESWFTDKGGARTADEMAKRIWWRNPQNDCTYFVLSHLIDFLDRQKKMNKIGRHKISRLLQSHFKAEQAKLLIKGKRKNVYFIRNFEFEDDTPLNVPNVERKENEI